MFHIQHKPVLFKGSAGKQQCQGGDGTSAGSGEPHERRQQDQRSGRRFWDGDPPQIKRCQKQGEV